MSRSFARRRLRRGLLPMLVALGGLWLLFATGCGTGSFVGRQYRDFTAYYNKFYNAEKAFEKGIEAVRESERTIDRTRYVSVFRTPRENAGEQAFEDAIQKSADVLRRHPRSEWVDDALLLIGKSYFYQQNYVGAAQKFREVLALDREQKREKEARFWLARTLVANGSYAEASEVLPLEQAAETPRDPWTARMYLVRGQLLVQQQRWDEAQTALERGLSGDVPEDVAARGAFLLGQVRETRDAPAAARAAYRRVQEHDPPYELAFAARLSEIEVQGQHGEADRALRRLRRLERDDKNREHLGEIAIVKARIYRAQGRPERARTVLKEMLYGDREDVSLSGTAESRLHYDLATLYRDAFSDFTRAAAHFDTASTTASRPSGRARPEARLPSAPVGARAQADQYRTLAERSREVARLDSLIRLGRMSDRRFQAFVQELRRKRAAAQEARAEARRQLLASRRFRRDGASGEQPRRQTAPAAETRESDAGFLFYNDPARVQEGRQQFRRTWGNRPRVDNWRRRSALQTVQAESSSEQTASGASSSSSQTSVAPERAEGTEGLDLSAVPRDSASLAKMEAERAVARYELANSLFLAAGRPDSAATWYRRVLQESGDHPVARQALYALAEAYRAQGDTTAARQAYERLVEQYPATELAARARERLGREATTTVRPRPAIADSAYAWAFRRWQRGEWRPALSQFLSVADRYPDTDAAPRALLASSIIYWQRMQADSLRPPLGPVQRYLRRRPASAARDGGPSSTPAADSGRGPSRARPSVTAVDSSNETASPDADPAQVDTTSETEAGADTTLWAGQRERRGSSDTTRAMPDSAAGPPADSTTVDTASALAADPYDPLSALLTHLTEQYPDAPQVERAQSMLALLGQRRAPADTASGEGATTPPSRSDSTDAPRGAKADTVSSTPPRRSVPDTARSTGEPLPAPTGS